MKRVLLIIGTMLILLPEVMGQDIYNLRKQARISTGLDEAAAVPFEDGIVYITQTTSVGASSPTDAEGRRLFTIFIMESGGQKHPFDEQLVTQRHEGPVSFTGDFNTMVFSQQRPSGSRNTYPLGLYFAERVDGQWLNIRAYEHNSDEAWLFAPALSQDGKMLVFSANFPDAIGGFDLYSSTFNGTSWSPPENLGPGINTEENELYPYLHPSGKLYFSSEGHDRNLAGYDIFESMQLDGKWTPARKLPAPFNTLSDEYHIYFSDDFKSGYLTTNRRSGSKEIYSFGTDIPDFESPEPIRKTYYRYRIYDRNLDTVDTNLFRYSWVINDTLEIPGHDIIYRFPEPGRYVCELKVFDIQLDTFVIGTTSNILNIALNEQAVITCPDTVRVDEPVQFDGSQTYLPGFDIGQYIWEFGDGAYGEGLRTEHTYFYPGTYRVVLGVEERRRNRRDDPEIRENYREIVVVDSD